MNFPADFGPIYKETLEGRLPVEPWDTASNLVFLLIFIYWAKKTHFDYRSYPSMGTHFLWHIFGGGSTFFLMRYIYLYELVGSRQSQKIATPTTSIRNDTG